MSELLLELFSEEIPSKMQTRAASQMLEILEQEIKKLQLNCSFAQYFVTPRRIALHVGGLSKELPEQIIEKKGPKIDARPEAMEGFLRSVGMKLEELSIIDGFYYAKKLEPAKPINAVLKSIIEQLLVSFTWPKSMRSAQGQIKWVRPLRNILCLFDGEILPVKFGHLEANNKSYGHRFMAPSQLEISSFADYQEKMAKNYVILSSEIREKIITDQVMEISKKLGLKPVLEAGLLAEVTGLVEYPHVLLGKIDEKFIALPKEVLVTAMKVHQRYFYLENDKGEIAPYFLTASNVKHENNDIIVAGNEKVLRARLSDAQFFWEKDLKQPSSEALAKLAKMTFHSKLGTMFDKVNRIISLAEYIATNVIPDEDGVFDRGSHEENVKDHRSSLLKSSLPGMTQIKKAALLCKTDLVSEMVGEFPELQGIMGKYYALHSGQEREVAIAIAEHYRPVDTNDLGDVSLLGAIIAVADKLDTIVGLWLAGEKPTSSKDPFALRRAALGIIKLIRHHKLNLSLSDLVDRALGNITTPSSLVSEAQPGISGACSQDSRSALLEGSLPGMTREIILFFNDRLKYYFKAENFRHDLIMASLNVNADNIHESTCKLIELQEFMNNSKSESLVFAIKRILSILSDAKPDMKIDESILISVELDLYNKIKNTDANLVGLLGLVDNVNKFFDAVMVNDPDPKLKQNRLNLLYNIANLSNKIADFSAIEA